MIYGKGAVLASEHSSYLDRKTGCLVHQMTSAEAINNATYFLQTSFTPGDQTMIFVSNRSGQSQLYEISIFPHGPIRQLTDGPPIHAFSPAIHPSGKSFFFVRGGGLWELDRHTLDERLIVEFPDSQLGEPSLGDRAQWLVMAIQQGQTRGLAVGKADGTGWHVIPFPRTVIHPQFHPLHAEWIEFSGDPAPRMHRIRRDGTCLECLLQHDNDTFIVHETFLGDTGNLVYTVWPKSLRTFDWTTGEDRLITEFNAWHITPNRSGTKVLCDTNHPDTGLYLIDVATGHKDLICLSESGNRGSQWTTSRYALAADFAAARSTVNSARTLSWMESATDTVYGPQWTHPHPSFSSDESKVVFTSDKTGFPQVYVAVLAS